MTSSDSSAPDADVETGPERFEPTRAPASSRWQIDLRRGEIRSVVWATGFRLDHSVVQLPVFGVQRWRRQRDHAQQQCLE